MSGFFREDEGQFVGSGGARTLNFFRLVKLYKVTPRGFKCQLPASSRIGYATQQRTTFVREINMPKSPKVQTNNTNNSITISKNKTNIQDAHQNSPSNKPDSNSMNIASHSAQTNKRNLSSSSNSASEPSTPNPNKNIILTKHKKKIFVTRNRFEVFAQDDSFETNTNENIPNSHQTNTNTDANTFTKPPPPIFVKGVEDYPELCTTLIELIGVDNFMCKSTTNSLKIQTTNPSAYRALIQFLKTEKAEYHTYQLNEDKPLRVVIRNLHSSTPLTLIKEELEGRCFEVRQVTNVLHKVNKNPLPLFFIDLEPTLQSNEIFQLSSLLHCKIKVEEPYKPKQISQCFNCQQYGHTRGYCGYHPRCVRCGADHQSSACPNSRDVPPKCVHCSQNHPANYKGCSIYKELQRRKIPSAPSNRIDNNYKTKSTNVQGSHPPSHAHSNPQTQTYAQATSNIPANDTSPPINATHPPDLNKLMSNFLDEFKTLINPLIALLTKVISKLLDK
ncbi:hypothetical protein QTP88_020597 [Uroleucon formosanum]